MLTDYAEHDQAIGLDGTPSTRTLSNLLDRHLPDPADRAFAEEHVHRSCPHRPENRGPSRRTDAHGPVLGRYDRWGQEVDHVVHHPTWTRTRPIWCRRVCPGSPTTPTIRARGGDRVTGPTS